VSVEPIGIMKAIPVSPTLLVIVHQREYHLGRLLPLFIRRRLSIRQVLAPSANFSRLQKAGFDGVVVLGGDVGVCDSDKYSFLRDEIEFLRATYRAQVPILGICLGGQLVTKALGGEVRPHGGREVGWRSIRVLQGTRILGPAGTQSKFLWHLDTFELPPGAEPLASTSSCLQAYRLGHTYALQFHPEMTYQQVAMLLSSPSADLLGVDEAEAKTILTKTARDDVAYGRAASQLVDAFCDEMTDHAALRTGEGLGTTPSPIGHTQTQKVSGKLAFIGRRHDPTCSPLGSFY
jgi:GMP synthase (glutamine-hydrolysing)